MAEEIPPAFSNYKSLASMLRKEGCEESTWVSLDLTHLSAAKTNLEAYEALERLENRCNQMASRYRSIATTIAYRVLADGDRDRSNVGPRKK